MNGDRLIRSGDAAPLRYKRMESLACEVCGEHFVVVHPLELADAPRAKKQAARYSKELSQEHANKKFRHHVDSYVGLEIE